jgi:hypothetical protein
MRLVLIKYLYLYLYLYYTFLKTIIVKVILLFIPIQEKSIIGIISKHVLRFMTFMDI